MNIMQNKILKICAYVQSKYAKTAYKKECFNIRKWVGLQIIVDSLNRAGYEVEYASEANVHLFDIVLVSITASCDWWSFIAERVEWQCADYKVIVGGAGVMNVRPFLPYADCFVLGRGENLITKIISSLEKSNELDDSSVIWAHSFSMNKQYKIKQEALYSHAVKQTNSKDFKERSIGCSHKCIFCSYTYHRKYETLDTGYYDPSSEFNTEQDAYWEKTLLDIHKSGTYNFKHLRTTAIDGFSERIRFMVAKPITKEILHEFFCQMARYEKPNRMKLYNIVGYPGETEDDWFEFLEVLVEVDATLRAGKAWGVVLHCTPFEAMPATPVACWPMSYINYRGKIAEVLSYGKNTTSKFYAGNKFFAVESKGTNSLSTVILSAIAMRGTESDIDNVERIAITKKFWYSRSDVKQVTLEKYFDVDRLFGAFTVGTLPTRNIRTYTPVEKAWGCTPWLKL
jgi:radical SAM superfamily enzyme YgiQ (UPF0313 family)